MQYAIKAWQWPHVTAKIQCILTHNSIFHCWLEYVNNQTRNIFFSRVVCFDEKVNTNVATEVGKIFIDIVCFHSKRHDRHFCLRAFDVFPMKWGDRLKSRNFWNVSLVKEWGNVLIIYTMYMKTDKRRKIASAGGNYIFLKRNPSEFSKDRLKRLSPWTANLPQK